MNNKTVRLSRNLCIGLGSILLIASGCTSLRDSLLRPVVVNEQRPEMVVTNYVTVRTNTVYVPATVDAAGNVLTQPTTIEHVVTLPIPVEILTTNPAGIYQVTNSWEKDPKVFETASIIGSAIPGWGQLAAGAFGAFGTLFAAFQNRKLKKSTETSISIIEGVEQFRRALQNTEQGREVDAKFVDVLQRAQAQRGAIDAVQKLIELHTDRTTPLDLNGIFGALTDPKITNPTAPTTPA